MVVIAIVMAMGPLAAARAEAAAPTHFLAFPELESPANYSSTSTNPILTWKPVVGALYYDVAVRSTMDEARSPECGGHTKSLQIDCPELPPGPYWWTVRAFGIGNFTGPPAPRRMFTKLPRSFAAPMITAPASGASFTYPEGMGLLHWAPLPEVASYQVQISADPAFPDPPLDPTQYPGERAEAMAIPIDAFGERQYWRVRALADHGATVGPWSATRNFTVRWPHVPTLRTPIDGVAVSEVHLTWDPVPGAFDYEVETAATEDVAFAGSTVVRYVDSAFVSGNFSGRDAFRWRVRARVGGNVTSWSTVRTVIVNPAADAAPSPVNEPLPQALSTMPADGAVVDRAGVVFDWETVDAARTYDLHVILEGQGWHESGMVFGTLHAPPVIRRFDAGRTYKWRVRANGADGVGPWSEERTFTTPPPVEIALIAPVAGAAGAIDRLVFTWAPIDQAPIQIFEISRDPDMADPRQSRVYADGRAVIRDALGTGTWYWRVLAGRNDVVAAMSPIRTVTILDGAAPAGRNFMQRSRINGPSDIASGGEDVTGWVTTVAASADGVTWTEFPNDQPAMWDVAGPAYGTTEPGPRNVWMRWRDNSGNWSPSDNVSTVWFAMDPPPDRDLPVTSGPRAIGVAPAMVISAAGEIPVRATWTSSDASTFVRTHALGITSSASSGMTTLDDGYEPTWRDVPVAPQRTYRLWAQAKDDANNVGTWTSGAAFEVRRYSENNRAVTYRGVWKTRSSPSYWLGKVKAASTKGAKATITVKARSIGFVSQRGPNRGRAAIFVNGTRVATIDLFAATHQPRHVVWSQDWTSSATRTVTVKVLGTAGRGRVDVDGFAVIR